jgi:hypothetical protein
MPSSTEGKYSGASIITVPYSVRNLCAAFRIHSSIFTSAIVPPHLPEIASLTACRPIRLQKLYDCVQLTGQRTLSLRSITGGYVKRVCLCFYLKYKVKALRYSYFVFLLFILHHNPPQALFSAHHITNTIPPATGMTQIRVRKGSEIRRLTAAPPTLFYK